LPRRDRFGAVAQLGERLVRNEEASGSIPLSSTIPEISRDGRTGNLLLKSIYQSGAYTAAMRSRLFPFLLGFLALLPALALAADESEPPKSSEHKLTQSKSYLSLEPIYATIVDDNRAQGMLMVGMGLDVPDDALREVATRSMPVLRDAYVRSLVAFTATAVRTNAQPDVAQIADRLQSITDRALGKKGARILLAQVAIRVNR
jgi:flagellar basal body-associated protein FliL